MNTFLNRCIVNGFLLLLLRELFTSIHIAGALPMLMGAFLLGFMNTFIRPFFIILSLPINILTLGLFTLIINALMLTFTAFFIPGFTISSFGGAFFGALLMSIINGLIFRRVVVRSGREER